ncbi:MAG TPA: S1C family serine protease [Caulobacteraceae bacterium]|nr:S1C family serine protease [Caulobacteraceae bacterium]
MFKRLAGLLAAVLSVSLAPSTSFAAEQWAPIVKTNDGSTVGLDVSGVVLEGGFAKGWQRRVVKSPERAPNGKRFWVRDSYQTYDCAGRRARSEQVMFKNDKGDPVDIENTPSEFVPISPESVGSQLLIAFCAVAKAEDTTDIREGDWRPFSHTADGQVDTYLDYSDIEKLDADTIVVTTRDDYRDWSADEGVPFKWVLETYIFDCKGRRIGLLASQLFIGPTKAVGGVREVSKAEFKAIPVVPGASAAAQFDKVCAAPRVEAKAGSSDGEGGVSVGTAWATNKGYLVTASHVIDGGRKIEVYQNSKKIGEATVVGNDPANDVAVLKYVPAGGAKLRIIPLSDKAGALGKSVFTLGFPAPDVMGQAIKMAAGDISATSGMQDDTRFMQISIPIQQGNSGGPVIGFDGSAVGVVSAKLAKLSEEHDAPRPENVNYAVKIAYVRPLLEELPDLADYAPIKVAGGTPEDLIAQAREAVFMLVVTR